jgi:hypothetical protein
MSVTTARLDRRGRPVGRRVHILPITLREELLQPGHVKRARDLEGPRERLAPDSELEALECGVHMRPTAGCPTLGIREDKSSGHRRPQQVCRTGSLPAPDTGALPSLARTRVCHIFLRVWLRLSRPTERPVYLLVLTSHTEASRVAGAVASVAPRSAAGVSYSAGFSVSGRMSIRQPVRRAARRAFWPSLPMARDNW